MAPMCPEEVDVFRIPHSRMKELVCRYLDMVTATNFSNVAHLTTLLESLIKTFQEFIAHEQIENRFIMKKLKNKLRSLSIQNTAVCNCHKDNTLTDMLNLFQDGYKCTKKSDADRVNYGLQLRQALEQFTETFIPHMEEEEEVFQPLLMQHFSTEELKQIKATVIQQHFKVEPADQPEKCVADNKSSKCNVSTSEVPEPASLFGMNNLPDEVLLKIFSSLNPKDLARCAQVSRKWNNLAMDGSLWTKLFPVSWAQGDWNAVCGVYEEDEQDVYSKMESKNRDEDADVDECDDWDSEAIEIQRQSLMLTSMCKHLLPRVGRSVKHCDLAYSKGITNGSLYKILALCPHLEHLDLTQTRVSDLGFKGFNKSGCGEKLQHLNLSGCLYITDLTLQRLSRAVCQIQPINQNPADNEDGEKDGDETSTDDKKEDKSEDSCVKCQQNQDTGADNLDGSPCSQKFESCCKEKTGEMKSGEVKCGEMKTSGVKKSCCMIELKSGNASHKCCSRAGPCQASMDSNQGCCDIEGSKRGMDIEGPNKWCDRKGPKKGQDNDGETCCGKSSDCESCELCGCRNEGCRLDDDCGEKGHNHGNRKRGVAIDRSEDERSRSFSDPIRSSSLDREHEEAQKTQTYNWRGSTVENLSEIVDSDIDDDDTMISVKIDNTVMTQNQVNQLNSEHYDEHTPADFNPGQTYLPDFILVQNTARIPYYNDNDSKDKNERTKDENIGTKPENDVTKDESETTIKVKTDNETVVGINRKGLGYLNLSGCYQITGEGLGYLIDNGGLPSLVYLDLSGCWNLDGDSVTALVETTPLLNPADLFYCDNILDGPYGETASGCQNLQCGSRFCCRSAH